MPAVDVGALAVPIDASGASVRTSVISGLGVAVPPTVVPNAAIAERIGVDERWIVQRTGIHSRRYLGPDERLSDLAADAGLAALGDADLEPGKLDLVLVATTSSDELMPQAVPLVASAIGAENVGAMDISAACTGFVSALALATASIEARRAEHVLVIGADAMSRHTNLDDRRTAALFGDGAGAVVVSAGDGNGGIGPIVLGADGAQGGLLTADRGGGLIEMNGHDTFVQAVRRLCEVTPEVAELGGYDLDQIDLFVFHQANVRILDAVAERLGLPEEKVVNSIAELGNTSAASVPLTLAQAQAQGALQPGAKVLLASVGAGFTWGATVVEWSS